MGPTLQASGVRLIALVKEAEYANDLLEMDGGDNGLGPIWTGEIYVDHTLSAFAAMGAGAHKWRFFQEMCNPRKCHDTSLMCCKSQLRMESWGDEVRDMPGNNYKGEGFKLGGCWIFRKKNTGQTERTPV